MKTLITLIGIIGFQYISLCQTTTTSEQTVCTVEYSESSSALISSASGPVKTREIVIVSLPSLTQIANADTPLNIEFGMTGSFTFKKDAALEVNSDHDVYIEDMLTGKVFNLKTTDSYTFNVNRRVPNRFVLHVDNLLSRYAVR